MSVAPQVVLADQRRVSFRAFALLEAILLLVGLGVLALHVLPRAWHSVNTDFPNDYVAARLVREGYTLDRIYEWEWFEQQRKRMGISQPVAGFIPHTPATVIPMLPFSRLDPLPAKRAWIVFNLALLAVSIHLIAVLARIRWQWIATAAFLSVPLYRNLEFGQYYILLLLLLTAALWSYERGYRYSAGLLTAIAAGLKIFPVLLVFFYLRKRDHRAVLGFLTGAIGTVLVSFALFGRTACTRFVTEVLPAALRGEAMDPFALAANSISALLHHLFLFDSQVNPAPVVHAPVLVGILGPLWQMLVLLPAILVCTRSRDPRYDRLQWCGLLTASLAISTLPASYNFVVLLLPCAIGCGLLYGERRWAATGISAAQYFLVGWPLWPLFRTDGFRALFAVPRLWCLLLLAGTFSWLLGKRESIRWSQERPALAGLLVLLVVQVISLERHEVRLYEAQPEAVAAGAKLYAIASPHSQASSVELHVMTAGGWRWAELDRQDRIRFSAAEPSGSSPWLVEEKGRQSLWSRDGTSNKPFRASGAGLDVYEFSTTDGAPLVFSAMATDHTLQLYESVDHGAPRPLGIVNARFPAVSPGNRWLAYSSLQRGNWHLRILDRERNTERSIGSDECNQEYPVWRDPHTLIFFSDCGRGLWQTTQISTVYLP